MFRWQLSPYGTSLLGAGAVHHIKPGLPPWGSTSGSAKCRHGPRERPSPPSVPRGPPWVVLGGKAIEARPSDLPPPVVLGVKDREHRVKRAEASRATRACSMRMRVRRGEYLVCGKRAICVIAATNRVLLLNAQGARYCPCVYPTGALPRLLSIRSGRGGPAAGDRE